MLAHYILSITVHMHHNVVNSVHKAFGTRIDVPLS
jgi:hypothetical protein